jgi:hypothetical protein
MIIELAEQHGTPIIQPSRDRVTGLEPNLFD